MYKLKKQKVKRNLAKEIASYNIAKKTKEMKRLNEISERMIESINKIKKVNRFVEGVILKYDTRKKLSQMNKERERIDKKPKVDIERRRKFRYRRKIRLDNVDKIIHKAKNGLILNSIQI